MPTSRTGLLGPRPQSRQQTRPMQINPGAQPADRRDGQYLQRGEVPQVGTRPVTPLWENVPNGQGDDWVEMGGGGGGGSASAGQARATTRSVEGNQLVANQLSGLLSGGSAYMQNATRAGLSRASARGNLNGSMSAGAAQRAAIDAGLPIAAQDASWYGRTAADNMDAENAASIENAGNETSASIAGANNQSAMATAILRSRQDREQAALGRNFERESNIWDSEEDARVRDDEYGNQERSDYRRGDLDRSSDFRREGIDSRSDRRRAGIDADTDVRRFGLDQRADNTRRRNETRDYAYRSVMDQVVQNPEEWDRDQISGVIDYFTQYGDELYAETYDDIFGGGP